MGRNLLQKVWGAHRVRDLPSGQTQLFVGRHFVHEVTSPQAFEMLRERGLRMAFPDRTFATIDHVVPTDDLSRPFADELAEQMTAALERNCREFGIRLFGLDDRDNGIMHVVGPELGLSQPGMTIACGDSHTSTHGAVGAVAFGIGTSQVRDVLATQCLAMSPLKVRRISVTGKLGPGTYAKDVILAIITQLGVKGGVGYAYEYAGPVIESMDMESRLTVCNMSIEGGARVGYINPDQTTVDYLAGRMFVPTGDALARACQWWLGMASDPDASYEDEVTMDGQAVEPMVTWGINPGQAVGISGNVPDPNSLSGQDRTSAEEALAYTKLKAGGPIRGTKIDVAFVGSCTNGRISDLREAARVAQGHQVADGVRALVVPGSRAVGRQAEAEGLPEVFRAAGFEWRKAGCSMCLAMNADKLVGDQICASSSNRNFKGRQGSPTGRTLLVSPAMAAAAAIKGCITDVREMLG